MIILMNAIGRLGGDPERRETKSGIKCTTFSLACSRKQGNQGNQGNQGEVTTWIRCIVFNSGLDNIISYLKKGSSIMVSGEMREVQTYMNKYNEPTASINLTVNSINFMPSNRSNAEEEDANTGF